MYQYNIRLGKELGDRLQEASKERNMSVESFIQEILNKYFVPLHTIDQEAMAKAYEEMGEINLELSK